MRPIWCLLVGLCLAAACSHSTFDESPVTPTIPTPVVVSPTPSSPYAGWFVGRTSQQEIFAVMVSETPQVTAVMVGYQLNGVGCLGVNAYTSTSAAVQTSESGRPSFVFTRPVPGTDGHVEVAGEFTSTDTAVGTARFRNYYHCGSGDFTWTATRKDVPSFPDN
jgi:hypothetical protein